MRFIISGDSAVAEEITQLAGERGVICSSFAGFLKDPVTFAMCPDVVAIHVGDGEELSALVDACRQKGWSFIYSSGRSDAVELPSMRGIYRYSATGYVRPSRFFDLAEVLLH